MSDNVVAADSHGIDPLKAQDELLRKITRNGSMSRTLLAIEKKGRALDLASIADITGLKPTTVRSEGVRKLKRLGAVVETKDPKTGKLYWNSKAHVQVEDGTE